MLAARSNTLRMALVSIRLEATDKSSLPCTLFYSKAESSKLCWAFRPVIASLHWSDDMLSICLVTDLQSSEFSSSQAIFLYLPHLLQEVTEKVANDMAVINISVLFIGSINLEECYGQDYFVLQVRGI